MVWWSPVYSPFIIAFVVFFISVIVWRCFLRTRWLHSLILSLLFGTLTLVMFRKIEPSKCEYETDVASLIEGLLFLVSTVFVTVLLVLEGCKANKRRQCLMCCRSKRELDTPALYEDRMFAEDSEEDNILGV